MLALEFVKPGEGDGRVPNPELTKKVQQACFARRLMLLTAGTYVNVIRIIPPLVTTAEEVDLALECADRLARTPGARIQLASTGTKVLERRYEASMEKPTARDRGTNSSRAAPCMKKEGRNNPK